MKIIYDYQIFSLQKYGGISRYFYEINNNMMVASGGEACSQVICPLYINEYISRLRLNKSLIGIKMPVFRGAARLYDVFNKPLTRFIVKRGEIDVIHSTYYSSIPCKGEGGVKILTVYDMIHELMGSYFSPKDRTSIIKKEAVHHSDHIICISENTRRDLLEITGIDPDKVSVSYLGFSLDTSSTGDQANCSLPTSRPYLLYVGNRRGYKNFNALLKVFAGSKRLYNDFDLVLFGGGSLTATELDLFRRHLVDSERVHYVEGNDDILAALYRGAAAFVYPSLYEGFGIPPLEAMSFGCPVVCSNTSSMPEVVGDAAALFDPTDSDDLLDALELVLYDADARAGLISRGYERITRFSWLKCAEQTYNIYKKALS